MTQLSVPPIPNCLNAPPRPMLARDADAMYWMSRYVERAEHVARLLLVNANLLIDVGELAPHAPAAAVAERAGRSCAPMSRLPSPATRHGPARRAAHDVRPGQPQQPRGAASTRARENARGIRENISAEMWESLNTLYWSIRSDDAPGAVRGIAGRLLTASVMTGSMLFQGLTDQTLAHDQRLACSRSSASTSSGSTSPAA